MLTTPETIDDVVRRFCADVVPGAEPVFVPVRPFKAVYGAGYCTHIVPPYVEEHGGEAVTGWTIWYQPEFLIEAEFHMNWRSPDGELIDLTPKEDGEKQILFVPQQIEYDLSVPPPWNRRRALVDTPNSRQIVMYGVMMDKLKAKYWHRNGPQMPGIEVMQVESQAQQIMDQNVPPKWFCPCQSGKKFKDCCGRPPGSPFESNM